MPAITGLLIVFKFHFVVLKNLINGKNENIANSQYSN